MSLFNKHLLITKYFKALSMKVPITQPSFNNKPLQ